MALLEMYKKAVHKSFKLEEILSENALLSLSCIDIEASKKVKKQMKLVLRDVYVLHTTQRSQLYKVSSDVRNIKFWIPQSSDFGYNSRLKTLTISVHFWNSIKEAKPKKSYVQLEKEENNRWLKSQERWDEYCEELAKLHHWAERDEAEEGWREWVSEVDARDKEQTERCDQRTRFLKQELAKQNQIEVQHKTHGWTSELAEGWKKLLESTKKERSKEDN